MERSDIKSLEKEMRGDQELYSYFVQRNVGFICLCIFNSNTYVKLISNI